MAGIIGWPTPIPCTKALDFCNFVFFNHWMFVHCCLAYSYTVHIYFVFWIDKIYGLTPFNGNTLHAYFKSNFHWALFEDWGSICVSWVHRVSGWLHLWQSGESGVSCESSLRRGNHQSATKPHTISHRGIPPCCKYPIWRVQSQSQKGPLSNPILIIIRHSLPCCKYPTWGVHSQSQRVPYPISLPLSSKVIS